MNRFQAFVLKINGLLERYHKHEDRFSSEYTCLDFEIMDMLMEYEKGLITDRLPTVYDIFRLTKYDEHLTKRALARGRFANIPLIAKRGSPKQRRYVEGIDLILENAVLGYTLSVNPSFFETRN